MTKKLKLDAEERELLSSYERGEWRSVESPKKIEQYQTYATAALEAHGLISIALPKQDLRAIRRKATEAGVPYQKLIADIVHQFASGKLVEKGRD
ncbi:MAG: antitoxin [Chloroflexi bacterium]|nr:antitoxin [Chloroflexota bacterium]